MFKKLNKSRKYKKFHLINKMVFHEAFLQHNGKKILPKPGVRMVLRETRKREEKEGSGKKLQLTFARNSMLILVNLQFMV